LLVYYIEWRKKRLQEKTPKKLQNLYVKNVTLNAVNKTNIGVILTPSSTKDYMRLQKKLQQLNRKVLPAFVVRNTTIIQV
jgi:hypothetical protein